MKYEVILDYKGYVSIIRHTGTIKDYVELDLSEYDLTNNRIYAYKLGKNKLIFDEKRYKEIMYDEQKKEDFKEINSLKSFLNETDYILARYSEEMMALDNPLTWIADVIKLKAKYYKEYKDKLAERVAARKRIEELEEKYDE